MDIVSGIYCIQSLTNNKKYIGSSINVFKRRNQHFSSLKNLKHKNKHLQSAYNKYGKDNFIFYVIEFVENKNDLISREQYHIDNEKPEYNINLIANSSLGVKRSPETLEKMRKAVLGLKHPEWRNKIKSEAQGGDNHWTKKKKFSEESKLKMSNSQKKLHASGYKHPGCKKILQYDLNMKLINTWDSAREASRITGFCPASICHYLKGKTKCKDFIWKYE